MLDATQWYWTPWNRSDDVFGFLKTQSLPVAVKDVSFDPKTFKDTRYEKNGVHLSFYGSGSISDYAAVLCDDGTIFFCVTEGRQFNGTFASADDIRMVYYVLTPLTKT